MRSCSSIQSPAICSRQSQVTRPMLLRISSIVVLPAVFFARIASSCPCLLQSAKAFFNCPSTSPTSATAPLCEHIHVVSHTEASRLVCRLCCGNSLSCALTSTPLSFACSPASATPTTHTHQTPSSFSRLLIPPKSPFGRPSGAPCPTPSTLCAPRGRASEQTDAQFRWV